MDYTLKPLTTIDINLALEHAKIFVGTYPSDMVPVARKDSAQAFVINTAPQSTQGEHWTAMILKGSKCLYFDSFGLPIQNHTLTTSLKNVGVRTYKYNSCQIQPILSNCCGYYCIAFIISYICDYSYADFLSHFISDVKQNDAICYKFIVEQMNKVS